MGHNQGINATEKSHAGARLVAESIAVNANPTGPARAARFFGPSVLCALLLCAGCSSSTTSPTPVTTPSPFVMTWPTLAFASTGIGQSATTPVVITLWNTGASPVPVASVTDSNTDEFPWTTTCQVGGSLPANSTCAVTAQFKPTALGTRTATLTIAANAASTGLALTGTGVPYVSPKASVTPASGDATTVFTLAVSTATPSGQVALYTTYTPAPGNPNISFTTTTWTADASGNLSISASSDRPGVYENWFVDISSGLSSNHIFHTVQ